MATILVSNFTNRSRESRNEETQRDRLERAHARGYQAEKKGKTKEICPYQTLDTRVHWLGGWRKAIEERSVFA